MGQWRTFHAIIVAFLLGVQAAEPGEIAHEIPILLVDGYMVIAMGTVKGQPLHFLIDTGAQYSVVDTAVAKRLELTRIEQKVQVRSFGKAGIAHRAILAGLRLGPIFTSLPCLDMDLPFKGIDAILGLDLLSRYAFSIDYRKRRMIFGPDDSLKNSVSIDSSSGLALVMLKSGEHNLQVSVDTGVGDLCLYGAKLGGWLGAARSGLLIGMMHPTGYTPAVQIVLPRLQLGGQQWLHARAMVLKNLEGVSRDGNLSPASLGLGRIHFDFPRSVLRF